MPKQPKKAGKVMTAGEKAAENLLPRVNVWGRLVFSLPYGRCYDARDYSEYGPKADADLASDRRNLARYIDKLITKHGGNPEATPSRKGPARRKGKR